MDSKKISKIAKGVAQVVVLVITAVCLCLSFNNVYYSFVYIDGESMSPTLKDKEYGFIDKHGFAIDSLKRFDIVCTYYPIIYAGQSDYCYIDNDGYEVKCNFQDSEHKVILSKTATYKVKRVVALPGEQFTLQQNSVSVRSKVNETTWGEWRKYDLPYANLSSEKVNNEPITLEKGEYWVIGDNWDGSTDCSTLNQRIYRKNIQGVLVGIEGTCKIDTATGKAIEKHKYKMVKYFKR